MPDETDWNGGRYWQAKGLNPDCGAGCPLERSVTHDTVETTNFGSGGQRESLPGLADESLYCPDHGVTWYPR